MHDTSNENLRYMLRERDAENRELKNQLRQMGEEMKVMRKELREARGERVDELTSLARQFIEEFELLNAAPASAATSSKKGKGKQVEKNIAPTGVNVLLLRRVEELQDLVGELTIEKSAAEMEVSRLGEEAMGLTYTMLRLRLRLVEWSDLWGRWRENADYCNKVAAHYRQQEYNATTLSMSGVLADGEGAAAVQTGVDHVWSDHRLAGMPANQVGATMSGGVEAHRGQSGGNGATSSSPPQEEFEVRSNAVADSEDHAMEDAHAEEHGLINPEVEMDDQDVVDQVLREMNESQRYDQSDSTPEFVDSVEHMDLDNDSSESAHNSSVTATNEEQDLVCAAVPELFDVDRYIPDSNKLHGATIKEDIDENARIITNVPMIKPKATPVHTAVCRSSRSLTAAVTSASNAHAAVIAETPGQAESAGKTDEGLKTKENDTSIASRSGANGRGSALKGTKNSTKKINHVTFDTEDEVLETVQDEAPSMVKSGPNVITRRRTSNGDAVAVVANGENTHTRGEVGTEVEPPQVEQHKLSMGRQTRSASRGVIELPETTARTLEMGNSKQTKSATNGEAVPKVPEEVVIVKQPLPKGRWVLAPINEEPEPANGISPKINVNKSRSPVGTVTTDQDTPSAKTPETKTSKKGKGAVVNGNQQIESVPNTNGASTGRKAKPIPSTPTATQKRQTRSVSAGNPLINDVPVDKTTIPVLAVNGSHKKQAQSVSASGPSTSTSEAPVDNTPVLAPITNGSHKKQTRSASASRPSKTEPSAEENSINGAHATEIPASGTRRSSRVTSAGKK